MTAHQEVAAAQADGWRSLGAALGIRDAAVLFTDHYAYR